MNHSAPQPVTRQTPLPREGAPPGGWRRMLREPLLHFMAIGAVLFGMGAVVTPSADRARVIDVTPDVRAEMAGLYRQRFGHDPNAAELKPLVDQWIRTEVLYREALALGLDKGDQGLRDRLISKMNLLVFQQAKPPDPTTPQLQAWFAAHRGRFDKTAMVDFLAVDFPGPDGEARAREAVAQIAAGTEPEALRLRARVYLHRNQAVLDLSFGAGFMAQLRAIPAGQWRAVHGSAGWFVARVDGLHEAKTATLDQNYDASIAGWRDDAAHALARTALDQLAGHYIIRGAEPPS